MKKIFIANEIVFDALIQMIINNMASLKQNKSITLTSKKKLMKLYKNLKRALLDATIIKE